MGEFTARVVISLAKNSDIPAILAIQEENLLPNKQKAGVDLEQSGFLLNPVNPKDLKRIIGDRKNCLVLVARQNGNGVGYVLAYDFRLWKKLHPEWDSVTKISKEIEKSLKERKVLYLRHIARSVRSKGVGKKLMTRLLKIAENRGYKMIIGRILERPFENKVSIEFHRRFGFLRVGSASEKNGRFLGIYAKEIAVR